MDPTGLAQVLRSALVREQDSFRKTLILNPVENIPFPEDIQPASSWLHGLYNTDRERNEIRKQEAKIQFGGRDTITDDVRSIYAAWAAALGADDVSMRLLSGLHAHLVVFMGLARPGQRVLLLPEAAGGHMSTHQILERLGLTVIEMVVDYHRHGIDLDATLRKASREKPDFVFVDRSEGLVVEDFSRIANDLGAVAIFDASQYITNIIAADHPNPFDQGFDFVVSSLHKNFPGPQRALVATRVADAAWRDLVGAISVYVSNMHVHGIYSAGLTLARTSWLRTYSAEMLACAVDLEVALADKGVPVVRRDSESLPTHHIWIRSAGRHQAFRAYRALEAAGLLVNFRHLPYGLGPGLRLGTAAAVRSGLTTARVPELADLVAGILVDGVADGWRDRVAAFLAELAGEDKRDRKDRPAL